ncbi:probably inactive leucine-rich repeat receptor-like protein kinase at5g48380 [Phtheirospermum japonicum]|uniref:Probably inactive leucine-rich repeat receptor-like protein kinase at5g48380 n=1 Tax=Phtheirospermum japonicum TaxID=374723 RepID=A0A830BN00_9LAMI|nr:probably inactive leucine-rich repeat receptor-like protein kinase at5g48380 [Phtheirospermum japonicum]
MSCIALASLQLLMIIGLFAIGESRQSDIDCLRSIKESLEDPLDMLSTWRFDNLGKMANITCSLRGIECWESSSNLSYNTDNIISIELRGMGLKGAFPRGIAKCSSLQILDLSNNHLYGSIPWDISRLFVYIVSLDLSYNNLSGEIPPGIANFSYLNTLILDNNLLTGRIPARLSSLQRLRIFSVANNQLSGPVPGFPNGVLISPESYENNKGLCGYPFDPCQSRSNLEYLFLGGGFFAGWAVFFMLSLGVGLFTPLWEFVIKFIKRRLIRLHSNKRTDDSPTHMLLEKFAEYLVEGE